MIKLLACDVDGTLLKQDENCINDKIKQLLLQIYNKNILLTIASGRSYPDLKRLFEPLSDNLYFICHDGALCKKQDKVLYKKSLSVQTLVDFIKFYSDKFECAAFYGENTCYIIGRTELPSVQPAVEINGVYDIKEQIYKIAVYNGKNSIIQKMDPIPFGLRVCGYGAGYLEYVSAFANKGSALYELQNKLFLTKFDTAAIGNDENDIKMFKNAKYSASLAPLHSKTASFAAYTPDNAETFLSMIIESNLH